MMIKKNIVSLCFGCISLILSFITMLHWGLGAAAISCATVALIVVLVKIDKTNKLFKPALTVAILAMALSAVMLTISILKMYYPTFFMKEISGEQQIYNYYSIFGLIIFSLGVVLFVMNKIPMATSAILICVAMVVFGCSDFKTTFAPFASSTVIMLVAVLAFGEAAKQTGISKKIAELFKKIARGSERVVIIITFMLGFVLSMWLTNVTVLSILIPVLLSLKDDEGKINPMNLIIPATLGVNCGGISTLVGSSQQMTAQGLLEDFGYVGFKVFDFTPYGCIIGAASLLYCLFIGYPLGKKIWGSRIVDEDKINEEINKRTQKTDFNLGKSIILGVIFVITIFMYIYQKIPFTDIKVPTVITAVAAALACIITGCVEQKKVVTKINWDIVGRLAGCLGIAAALSACGGVAILSNLFSKIGGQGINPFLLFVIMVFLAQFVSLFISNSTAISITLIVIVSMASTYGLNAPAYAMGIALGSSLGASCPLSGSTWGISMAGGYKFSDYFKYGVLVDLIGFICIISFVPLFMGLTV